ncbi:amidohydrolase family protein [Variovorax sp. Sphag1AA]|uniref:metal-dependent hydrolase family protein n=1 Tax=Variovorax sp. Sphag1AA TaxID=2587027 RepID=UPI00161C9BD9|nr:amidohydrolase family protein [Variovorax sp. Sphag1AA]MBB3182434.1 imidazolonepropionase-like amidohydrolase [Variovorax sp. Sphag1AA]
MSKIFEIAGCTLIDGTGREPLRDATLRAVDGRITAVWTGEDRPPAARCPADEFVQAGGRTVLPGLIDSHCHISYGEGKTAEEVDIYGGAEWAAVRAVWNAQKVLHSGFTSFCDPGSTWNVAVTCRDAINNGMFDGPRIFAAGRHISADGGFADYFPGWLGMPVSAEGVLCPTPDSMRSEVRRQVKNRVDLIKISGDSQAQDSRPDAGPCFTADEMACIVQTAHGLGRKVTIHSRYAKTVAAAARAGVDWVIHASYMDAADIGLLRDLQIPVCPTMTYTANIVQHGREVGVDPNYIEVKKRELDSLVKVHRRSIEAGIPMMAGSEAGFSVTPYGLWHAREIELMVELLGMSPLMAISTGTYNNAKAFGWDNDVGSLQPGRWADLLLLESDPLQDIRVLGSRRSIAAIYKGGERVEKPDAPAVRRRLGHERSLAVSTLPLTR